jgi:putative Mn2+ efflux pump MntP
MTPLAIFLLSISMSADAFAASVAKGAVQRPGLAAAVGGGLVFGIVEAITPLVGFLLGGFAAEYVEAVDHWIAFGLLGLVGLRLVVEGLRREPGAPPAEPARHGPLGFVLTAIGTSIDAAAVGVSLAFLDVNIWVIAASIGCSTFILTTIGLLIGRRAGDRLGATAEVAGGVVLIGVGTFILLDHLGHSGGLSIPG